MSIFHLIYSLEPEFSIGIKFHFPSLSIAKNYFLKIAKVWSKKFTRQKLVQVVEMRFFCRSYLESYVTKQIYKDLAGRAHKPTISVAVM